MGYYEKSWPILITAGIGFLILSVIIVPLGLLSLIMYDIGYPFLLFGLFSLRWYLDDLHEKIEDVIINQQKIEDTIRNQQKQSENRRYW